VLRFVPGESLQLEANPAYWRDGYPRSAGLIFNFGVSPDDILENFRSGHFHLASDLVPADAEALRHEVDFAPGYRETPRLSTYWLAFNTRQGRFADPAARHRIASRLDAEALVEQYLGRLAVHAHTLIPPDLVNMQNPSQRSDHSRDHGESGMTTRLSVDIDSGASPADVTVAISPVFVGSSQYGDFARALYAALAQLGLRVRVVNATAAELFEAIRTASVDLVLARWAADYPDADSFMHGMLDSQSGFIAPLCASAELDGLIQRARKESDTARRHAIYQDVERLLSDQALLLPLFHEQVYRFAAPTLRGVGSLNFLEPVIAYENLRLVG
jgi:ABC-type oligopeptide transport system substrate-binding subunit